MYDETIPSFEFVFEAFLSAISSKAPTTILTDQDKVMAHAISTVMPNTCHRICLWHMHQNAMKNLGQVYTTRKAFRDDFNKCIYKYEEEVDFLVACEKLLETYNLRAHAISIVMPNPCHRICLWHMHKNAMKNLGQVYTTRKSVRDDFKKCIYECEEEVDFLDAWEKLLETYNLQDNEWLKKIFEEKEKWALVYGRNTFYANMKSTQRSKSMNSLIRKYLDHTYNLLNFFPQWERLVMDRRKK